MVTPAWERTSSVTLLGKPFTQTWYPKNHPIIEVCQSTYPVLLYSFEGYVNDCLVKHALDHTQDSIIHMIIVNGIVRGKITQIIADGK